MAPIDIIAKENNPFNTVFDINEWTALGVFGSLLGALGGIALIVGFIKGILLCFGLCQTTKVEKQVARTSTILLALYQQPMDLMSAADLKRHKEHIKIMEERRNKLLAR